MKLSELLEGLLLKIHKLHTGLCLLNYEYVEGLDYYDIQKYLKENKPLTIRTLHHAKKNVHWWKPGKIEPRKKWLEKHIKKLKAKGL